MERFRVPTHLCYNEPVARGWPQVVAAPLGDTTFQPWRAEERDVIRSTEKPIGVIDALSTGYRVLIRRWPLLLIPFSLDVFFWLGPQVSPWAAFKALLQMADPEVQQVLTSMLGADLTNLTEPTTGPNLLTALVQAPGAPGSLAAALGALPTPAGWTPLRLAPASPWQLVALTVVLVLLGAPLAGLYMSAAARALPDRPNNSRPFWREWLWATVHLEVITLLGLFLFAGATVGLSLLAVVGLLIGPAVATTVLALGSLFISWAVVMVLLFVYFAPASIALQHAGAFQAIGRSVVFVLRNLWSTVGLILVSMLITEGFALIWQRLFSTVPGAVVSMAGNAFLTTGLTLGTLIFFLERNRQTLQG